MPTGSSLLWLEPSDSDTDMALDPSPLPSPSSPRPRLLHVPMPLESDNDLSYTDTVMPADDEDDTTPPAAQPPLGQLFQSLPNYTTEEDLMYLTPAPRSPHAMLSELHDLDMDDDFIPSSPHSPHSDLPELFDEELYPPLPMDTISPSLLSPAPETPEEGLGLFIQPDPPLRRSPSPEDDALQFLDIQFDPAASDPDVHELLSSVLCADASLTPNVTRACVKEVSTNASPTRPQRSYLRPWQMLGF